MTENWKQIPTHPDYEVSDLGRVRSLKTKTPRVLKAINFGNGYLAVSLHAGDGGRRRPIHRLVLVTFSGEDHPRLDVRHKNGDKHDNRFDNLHWGTRSENMVDEVKSGRNVNAAKTHCKNGHEYTEENTYVNNNTNGRPRRDCKVCAKGRAKSAKARKKEATC